MSDILISDMFLDGGGLQEYSLKKEPASLEQTRTEHSNLHSPGYGSRLKTPHHSVAMWAILELHDDNFSGVSFTTETRESGQKDERKTWAAYHDAALLGFS